MISSQPGRARHSLEFLVRRWADLYRRRFYQLALFEIQSSFSGRPTLPIARFLEGQTYLALNRPDEAKKIFGELRKGEAGVNPSGEAAIAALEERLPEVLAGLDEACASNPHLVAPTEPFGWLEDASLIGASAIAGSGAGGGFGSSHIPGSLIEPIEIFPDRENVLRQIARQGAEDARRLAREVIEAAEDADLPLAREWEEAIASAGETETLPSVPTREKPVLGPPAIRSTGPREVESPVSGPVPAGAPTPIASVRETAWEDWKREFETLVQAEKTHQALSHVEVGLETFGDRPELYVSRARLLGALGSEREAAESLADAAMAAYRQGDREQATVFVEEILSLPRLSPRALLSFAAIFISGGMAVQGEQLLRETLDRMRRENDLEGMQDALGQLSRLRPGNPALRREMDTVARRLADRARQAAAAKAPPPVRRMSGKLAPVAPPPPSPDVHRPGQAPAPQASHAPAERRASPSPEEAQKLIPISLGLFIFGGFAGLSGAWFLSALMGGGLLMVSNQFSGSKEAFIQRMVIRGGGTILLILSVIVFLSRRIGIM